MSTPDVTITLSLLAAAQPDIAAIEEADAAALDEEGEENPAPPRPAELSSVVVSEEDAAAFFAANPGRLAPFSQQDGAIEIACGGAVASFADTFLWLGPRLCFQAVEGVLRTGEFTVPMFSTTTRITLRRTGDTVEVSADIMDPERFPAMAVLQALLDAGKRVIAMAEAVWPGDPDLAAIMPWLQARADAAEAQLHAAAAPAPA